jgi:flagellar hook-associated protein 2
MGTTSSLSLTGLGLGTGINVQQFVQSLVQTAEAPEQQMQTEQTTYSNQLSAISNINNLLSNVQNDILNLQDPLGPLGATIANSSDAEVVTATTGTGATAGTHSITVNSLATTSSYATDPLATGDTTFGTGQFTLQVGSNSPVTITVDSSNDTLNTLASAINSGNYGVTASVVTDANGARLSLVSNTSGAPGNITVSGNTTGLTFNQTQSGVNSSFSVDGVPLNSSSNSVSGVIPGVTLSLVGPAPNTPVALVVGPDTTQAATAIGQFVSDYNAAVQAINTQFTYNANSTTQEPLFSDSSLQLVQQTLQNDANFAMSGNNGITGLSSLGINLQQDGTLQVDSGALGSALTNNYSAVQNFFQQVGSQNGFAVQFNSDLSNLTNPTSGPLYIEAQGINQANSDLASQIADFQANITQQEQLWTQEYSQLNATLQSLPLQLQQIDAQMGMSAPGSSSGSSSL